MNQRERVAVPDRQTGFALRHGGGLELAHAAGAELAVDLAWAETLAEHGAARSREWDLLPVGVARLESLVGAGERSSRRRPGRG
jgi:hypothetical protein